MTKQEHIEEMKDKETRIEFKVIDNNTGKEADIGKIALKEDWAKDLMYCDMQGFAILDDGNLILLDECGKFEYCPSERFSIKFENSVVLSREEYEKLKSLYDTQKGAYMTSCIGDLPLTVKGLRKAVDEITRLNRVETELQELNIKYYNEAKDSRRELKQARKETAEKFAKLIEFHSISKRDESGYETFTISNLCMREILREEFGFTNE